VIKDGTLQPSGPADLRRDVLTQRGRIIDAMARAVSARGYANTAVADVIAEGGMSRRTFYKYFSNKEDCFLAAYDFAVEHVAQDVVRAYLGSGPNWRTQMRCAFERFIGYVVAEPAFARLCLVEVLAGGPRALERRAAAVARFTAFIGGAAANVPGRELAPPLLPEAIVGGVQSVISARLLQGRADELPDLVDDLIFWGMVPFVGHPPSAEDVAGAA